MCARCLDGGGGCLEVVGRLSGRLRWLSGGCGEGVGRLSGGCGEAVWMVSGDCL